METSEAVKVILAALADNPGLERTILPGYKVTKIWGRKKSRERNMALAKSVSDTNRIANLKAIGELMEDIEEAMPGIGKTALARLLNNRGIKTPLGAEYTYASIRTLKRRYAAYKSSQS